ncbi:MAG: protein kinase [bacterium]
MKNPFIAGNWVRGENFFGRKKLIEEILEGHRNYLWIAGTRRFGKTSFLKQLELLTQSGPYAKKYISLFWDMQGSQNLDGLQESLLESVEDGEERFENIDVAIDELEDKDVFGILRILKRKAKEAKLNLMLLCDEVEELINIEKNNPEVLPKLRRFFQRGDNVFTILTATKRLSVLEHTSIPNTSPFLYGFVPPVYLGRLENDEALRLIQQWDFNEEQTSEILEKTDNHPYLMQLICRRLIETNDLKKVIDEVSHDDMIRHFFSVDFQYLQNEDKEILRHLQQNQTLSLEKIQSSSGLPEQKLEQRLYELVNSGTVYQIAGEYKIANYFFWKWLEREKEHLYDDARSKRIWPTQKEETTPLAGRLPKIGERLADHEILEKIGAGGMGVVFKGRDVQLDRIVALKVLSPDLIADPDFKKRFLLEARAASSLSHPNICTVFRIGEDRGVHFISMEYVDGETLLIWNENSAHPFTEKIRVSIDAVKALAHAHQNGIIHRDVKPENIMVSLEGAVKVMDFGLAKMSKKTENLTKSGTTLGTLAYMSPEQASGLPLDVRSDIFSFGVVLYELFTGKQPFTAEYELSVLYAIINEEPEPLLEVNPELPVDLEKIVHKTLQKEKEARYQSMEELKKDLEQILT